MVLKSDFKIRLISESEYNLLGKFLYTAIYIPEWTPEPPFDIINSPELQVYINDFGSQPSDIGFVAEIGGEIVGAVWSRIMNDYGHIDDETPSLALSVLEGYRRRGIATALLTAILERLAGHFRGVSLSVQKENLSAVNLYRKFNFGIVREDDAEYIMLLNLERMFVMTEQTRDKIIELIPAELLEGIAAHKVNGVKINIANYVARHNPDLVTQAETDLNDEVSAKLREEIVKYIKSLLH